MGAISPEIDIPPKSVALLAEVTVRPEMIVGNGIG